MYFCITTSALSHPNIIKFYGIYTDRAEMKRIWIVMEYMDLTLKEAMAHLKSEEKIQVAYEITKAMFVV